MKTTSGVARSVEPTAWKTITLAAMCSPAMVVHTSGKTSGGGVHEGRRRSEIAERSEASEGRFASSGEKVRERSDCGKRNGQRVRKHEQAKTRAAQGAHVEQEPRANEPALLNGAQAWQDDGIQSGHNKHDRSLSVRLVGH